MFVLRGTFTPATSKEERRLVKKMREFDARVDTDARKMFVRYVGNDIYAIASIITIVGNFPGHELSLHEL